MPIIPVYSRMAQHRLTTAGATFSIPTQEDFTLGGTQAWTANDLVNGEIGINLADARFYFRTNNDINELLNVKNIGAGLTYSGGTLSSTGGGSTFSGYYYVTEDTTPGTETFIISTPTPNTPAGGTGSSLYLDGFNTGVAVLRNTFGDFANDYYDNGIQLDANAVKIYDNNENFTTGTLTRAQVLLRANTSTSNPNPYQTGVGVKIIHDKIGGSSSQIDIQAFDGTTILTNDTTTTATFSVKTTQIKSALGPTELFLETTGVKGYKGFSKFYAGDPEGQGYQAFLGGYRDGSYGQHYVEAYQDSIQTRSYNMLNGKYSSLLVGNMAGPDGNNWSAGNFSDVWTSIYEQVYNSQNIYTTDYTNWIQSILLDPSASKTMTLKNEYLADGTKSQIAIEKNKLTLSSYDPGLDNATFSIEPNQILGYATSAEIYTGGNAYLQSSNYSNKTSYVKALNNLVELYSENTTNPSLAYFRVEASGGILVYGEDTANGDFINGQFNPSITNITNESNLFTANLSLDASSGAASISALDKTLLSSSAINLQQNGSFNINGAYDPLGQNTTITFDGDASTNTFTFQSNATGSVVFSSPLLAQYTQPEWLNANFGSYSLITKGYLDYLGLSGSYVYYTENTGLPAAKVQILENNRTIETLWRGASGSAYIQTKVVDGNTGNTGLIFIDETSVSVETTDTNSNLGRGLYTPTLNHQYVFDNATSNNVASLFMESQTGQGYVLMNAIGTSRQDIFNLDPSGANGGTYWQQSLTSASDKAVISLNYNSIYKEVFDSSLGTSTIINMTNNTIEMTTDSDTTHFNMTNNGAGTLIMNIVGLPGTASNSGDVWVDANNFLRIVP